MATETPNPSTSDVLDAYLPLTGTGVGEAQLELLRRLSEVLPDVIDEWNTRKGLTDGAALPKPSGYEVAPNVPADTDLNKILVGMSIESNPQGIGGAFKNEIEVAVFSLNHRVEFATQVLHHWQRAELIRAVLRAFISGAVDAEGRVCWRSLVPTGISMLPVSEREYSGVVANFRMVIPPI